MKEAKPNGQEPRRSSSPFRREALEAHMSGSRLRVDPQLDEPRSTRVVWLVLGVVGLLAFGYLVRTDVPILIPAWHVPAEQAGAGGGDLLILPAEAAMILRPGQPFSIRSVEGEQAVGRVGPILARDVPQEILAGEWLAEGAEWTAAGERFMIASSSLSDEYRTAGRACDKASIRRGSLRLSLLTLFAGE